MTRHTLLPTTARRRSTTPPGGGQTDPEDPGGGTGDPTTPALPTVDAVTMSIRPTLPPTGTIVIAKDGTGDYTTFAQAYAAVPYISARATKMAVLGLTQPDPRCRVDILVKPGTYTEANTGTVPGAVAVYALDPTPGSTVLECGQENDGSHLYWEGVDIHNVGTGAEPKYPFHLHQYTGATNIFARCTLDNLNAQSGGGDTPFGVDGDPGSTLLMHRVTFASGQYTNIHGWTTWTAANSMTTIFNECGYPTGSLYWNSLNDNSPDDVWVQKCDALTAGCVGAATNLHISPDTTLTGYPGATYSARTGTVDSRTDWPVPYGALTAAQRTTYGIPA